MTDKDLQSPGRKANAAQPLGRRDGLVSKEQTEEIGKAETRSAGPDGPDARETARLVGKGPPTSSSQSPSAPTKRKSEAAAAKVAGKAGTVEDGENLAGPDAGGESETDLGRGGD